MPADPRAHDRVSAGRDRQRERATPGSVITSVPGEREERVYRDQKVRLRKEGEAEMCRGV